MQIPLYDAGLVLLGVIVGAILSATLTLGRDWWQNRKLSQDIRNVLGAELSRSLSTLKKGLSLIGKNAGARERGRILVTSSDPLHKGFPLSTKYYDKLDIPALAKTLEKNALETFQDTYFAIEYYNDSLIQSLPEGYAFSFERSSSQELASKIEETLRLIKAN